MKSKVQYLIVIQAFLMLLLSCQPDQKVDVTTEFDHDVYMQKVRANMGGFYKGDDLTLYYSEWYSKLFDHPLFDDYIKARIYFMQTLVNNQEAAIHTDDFKCLESMVTAIDPKVASDPVESYNLNHCVYRNITKHFESDIPEYAEMLKNKEKTWNLNYYIIAVYPDGVAEGIINNRMNNKTKN